MPRLRLAVALLVPGDAAVEIDGLRRALGDPGLDSVVPHLTLVPPVNVRLDDVVDVLRSIRAAAAGSVPLTLRLGPPATFAPATPVVYLPVDGDIDGVRRLQAALRRGPMARPLVHEFVPHVTLHEACAPERIDAALRALAGYTVEVRVDRVHLLRDRSPGPRRWNPIADARFEPPLVVGRGGREVEVTVSSIADPEVVAWFAERGVPVIVPGVEPRSEPRAEPVVVVARSDGAVVAGARGSVVDGAPVFDEVVGDGELTSVLLRAAEQSLAARLGSARVRSVLG